MSASASVYVIIVTHNRWQDTNACLGSVYSHSTLNLHVVVVDSGSTDETLTLLPLAFPRAELISTANNLGYAEGNNLGIRLALERRAEFIVLLNNDVVVGQNWLAPLIAAANQDKSAALLGPLVYHADELEVIQSAGGILPPSWHSTHRGQNEHDRGQFSQVERVDWLTGCAVMARSSALSRFGLLDPEFYMYGEDIDWCVRATRAGYHVILVPQSRVWHKGVRRNYTPAPYITYYSARNELQLIRKHHGGTLTLARAFARHARTISSWTFKPRWQDQQAHRDALARALFDFVRGASGKSSFA